MQIAIVGTAYDPVSMAECKRRIGERVTYAKNMYDTMIDGRNVFDQKELSDQGFIYHSIGR